MWISWFLLHPSCATFMQLSMDGHIVVNWSKRRFLNTAVVGVEWASGWRSVRLSNIIAFDSWHVSAGLKGVVQRWIGVSGHYRPTSAAACSCPNHAGGWLHTVASARFFRIITLRLAVCLWMVCSYCKMPEYQDTARWWIQLRGIWHAFSGSIQNSITYSGSNVRRRWTQRALLCSWSYVRLEFASINCSWRRQSTGWHFLPPSTV